MVTLSATIKCMSLERDVLTQVCTTCGRSQLHIFEKTQELAAVR